MKENLKKQSLIFLLLLLMGIVVIFTVFFLVIDIHWSVKVITPIVSIPTTFYLFMLITKLNKQLVYVEKTKEAEVVETVDKSNRAKHICPKCYNHMTEKFALFVVTQNLKIKIIN